MKSTRGLSTASAVMGVALCVAMSAGVAQAQGPGGQGGPGGGQGGFGGRGGQGGFGGGRPSGTITEVDRGRGQLKIQGQGGNAQAQTVQLQMDTQWVTQSVVTVADLKVGDQIQVQGVPTGITASSITAGQPPAFLQGGGPGGGPGGGQGAPGGANAGGANAGGPAGGANAGGAGQGGQQTPFASATGRVTALDPLTVALSDDVSLTVKLAANARVTKFAPIPFSSVKAGDRVVIAGQAGQDGTFVATGVGVNLETTGLAGFGGRGGRGGQGGFGGQGGRGGQGGAGAQGGAGGRGGRGGRGGQGQGGQGGAGGAGEGGESNF